MRHFPKLWLAFCLVVVAGSTGCVPLNHFPRSNQMDKTGWITHCFGRFLIDLPPRAVVRPGYQLWGDQIKRLDDTPAMLAARIDQRERELKAQQHRKRQGSMFIRRIEHGNGSTSLLSWDSDASVLGLMLDSYLVSRPTWRVFRYKGEVTYDKEQRGIEISDSLARNLRSREPNEIPTGPGFCIDGGYIAGDTYQNEGFMVGVTFPDHPGASFSFRSSTGAEEDRLLDRIGGFLKGAAKLVAGIETLRKGQRAGAIPADEYLVAGSDKQQRVYSFAWESQGKNRSLTEPNLAASLGVLERSPDNDGNPPPPAFRSDQDALALWDAIVGSIRLRPGAASSLHLGLRADSGMPCPWPGVWVCDDQPDAGERIIGYGVAMPRIDGKVVTWRMVRGS